MKLNFSKIIKKQPMKNIDRRPQFKRNMNRRNSTERNISIGLKLRIWLSDVMVIIGGGFLLMGLPFVLVFVPFASLFAPGFSDSDPIVEGKITEVHSTNASVNEEYVYEYTYIYTPPDGGNYEGKGYSTGQYYEMDEIIIVTYKRNQQEISKARELRLSSFPVGVGFIVLIFPLIGIIMFYFGAKKARNAIYILKIGEIAYGKFLHKEATNTKINDQTVFKLFFEFTAKDDKVYQTFSKTHKTYRLQDEEQEKLVYDPDNPENAVLIDALPRAIRKYFEREE
ncbi:MAG: hypothetical protein DRJ10_20435 [Bacteroidetes bacterium]|nr:MAG: hypothetical protein DRJ10_20435 [Bacteroidota bacterium]